MRIEFSSYDVVIGDNRLDPLEVGKFYGLSNRIDANVLRFRYNYDAGAACNVHYDRQRSHLPQLGKIVDGQGENTLDSFDLDCRDFLTAGLQVCYVCFHWWQERHTCFGWLADCKLN